MSISASTYKKILSIKTWAKNKLNGGKITCL